MYRSNERLLLTADGKVVKGDDPKGVTLLVAEGGELPYADAIKHGLIADPKATAKQEVKAEALPLPTSAEAAEKVGDVLPKSVGTKTEDAKTAASKDAKPEKK